MTDADPRPALDAATAALRATAAERRAVRAHQALNDHRSPVADLLRGVPLPPGEGHEAVRTASALDALLARARLPADLVLYRGVRDDETYPPLDRLPLVISRPELLSTSLSRGIAVEAAAGGAVLRLLARRRTRGLWLPPLGYRRLAYEEEVLLPRGSFLRMVAWGRADGVVEVYCEVM